MLELEQIVPGSAVIPVTNDSAEVIPTDEAAVEVMQRQGCVRIGQHELQDLMAIGAYSCGPRLIQVSQGRATVIQQNLGTMLANLTAMIGELKAKPKKTRRDIAAMAQISNAVANIAAKMTDLMALQLSTNGSKSGDGLDNPMPLNHSFAPGQPVRPANV